MSKFLEGKSPLAQLSKGARYLQELPAFPKKLTGKARYCKTQSSNMIQEKSIQGKVGGGASY